MKKCKNCQVNDAVKYSKYSNGNFCSRACARAYSTKENRLDINIAVSKTMLGRKTEKGFSMKDIIIGDDKSEKMLKKWKDAGEKIHKIYDDKIMNADYSTLSYGRLKKRILLEQNNKCNRCGNDEWLGEKLTLELEHIDGNHHNNHRENLEALCPNCHSLTPTWRGRNKNKNIGKVSDEQLLISLIVHDFNFRQSLIDVGLAPKGGNYVRCHRLKREYENV